MRTRRGAHVSPKSLVNKGQANPLIRGEGVRIAGVRHRLVPGTAQPFGGALALQPLLQGQLFARLDFQLQRRQADLEVDGQPARKQVAADINFVIDDAGVLRLKGSVVA